MNPKDSEAADLQVELQQDKPVSMNAALHCHAGEMLALVGPSGSGKTTLLRSIAGLHRAEHAYIRCGNELWNDSQSALHVRSQQRRVGLVFQEYALFPHKSALENVMLATPGGSAKERRHKAIALLEKTNMMGLEQRMPGTLSGGQKQRVALARALAREPRVLLLDEPFSAVDQQTRRKLYSELASLRQSLSLPIILVTHDLTEVQLLADTLCLMHRGSTLSQGPVASVINFPESREIARLVGHQNLFHATVTGHDSEHTLYQLGRLPVIRGPLLHAAAPGSAVSLLIAPSAIHVLEPGISSPGRENDISRPQLVLTGFVQEWVTLGDEMAIRLHLRDVTKSLRFKLPLHVGRAAGIQRGSELLIGVPVQGIHAMVT